MNKTKSILLIALSLISLTTFSNRPDTSMRGKESTPRYTIVSNVPDKSLPKTEAVFTFCCSVEGNLIKAPIKYSYNGINKTATPDSNGKFILKVKPGKFKFKFYYALNYFEIYTDSILIKPGYREEVKLNFQSSEVMQISDKPVIYVYPKESTEVKITLDLKGEFSFTYPKYDKGWSFTADPNGTISMNNPEKNPEKNGASGADKKYEYLFWDGQLKMDLNKLNWNEGFEVKKADQVKFFEEKLAQMGLSPREIEDYITYWVPRMAANEKNYIHFIFNDEYNAYANLTVTPTPDKIFRVYMMWAKAEGTNAVLSAQKLPSFTRTGFTVVEWGGTEMNNLPVTLDLDFEN